MSKPNWLPLREDLSGLEPYGAPQLDVPVAINVNENPFAPSADLVAAIASRVAEAATTLNRYPDRDFAQLRKGLSDYLAGESGVRVSADNIWAANGSNEVMLHIFSAFGGPGRTALSFEPTYSMYHEYARTTFTRWLTRPRAADFSVDLEDALQTIADEQPSIIVLTSPNNPTGTYLPASTTEAIARAAGEVPGGCIVVIDEAYIEFRRAGTPSALELLSQFPHLVVSRTMSKAFGLAGARLGYLAADRAVIDALKLVRLPYHLSAVTQATALAALEHTSQLQEQVAHLRAERDALVSWLSQRAYRGQPLRVADSDSNFIWFGKFENRAELWQNLLDRGVLIRQTGPDGWLRVSVGTAAENEAFRTALAEVLAQDNVTRERVDG